MRIAVVGGGAAGCMAAAQAARRGAEVTLYEGNEKLLKKMFITGKGRCNVTNATEGKDFLENVVTNPRFLYSALSAFDSGSTVSFFEGLGVPLKVERGNRVFPVSDKSSDLTRALARFVRESGVRVRLNDRVRAIVRQDDVWQIQAGECGLFERVIVTTGGASYPATGSGGDGYAFARALGHRVVPAVPALAGIDCAEDFFPELAGLTLKNVGLKCRAGDKIFCDAGCGELLFTHTGVSGPLALSLSSRINRLPQETLSLEIDLKPALTAEELDARVLRDFAAVSNRAFKNAWSELLPKSLIPVFVRLCPVPPEKPVNRVTGPERSECVNRLKRFRLGVKRLRPLAEAIVTAGGVDVTEVNPKTMESKLAPGLYFAGEVLDVDALTGGFNLQIAFSTGYAAGLAAAAQ